MSQGIILRRALGSNSVSTPASGVDHRQPAGHSRVNGVRRSSAET